MSANIIYNQTWEDPKVDFEVLQPARKDVFLCIISGGCNVLNLALQNPAKIFAVDKNYAQYALLELKIAAVKGLNYIQFWMMFGEASSAENVANYKNLVRKYLSDPERRYWDKNIRLFADGFYKTGRLGTLDLLRKWIIISCGEDNIKEFVAAKNLSVQKAMYFEKIRPRLWNPINTYIPGVTMFLYGVGWRQVNRSVVSGHLFLKDIFAKRLDYLFNNIFIGDNYFWQRILLGKYKNNNSCPDYLKRKNFDKLKLCVDKIDRRNESLIEFLKTLKSNIITKFSLSDVPDFLSKTDQIKLWTEVKRVGKNNALVLDRSFNPNLDHESAYFSKKEMTGSYASVCVYKINKLRMI